jgi:plasmid stabilization system protein ParE
MGKIKWDKNAAIQFRKAISYIREDSPQNAEKVKREILSKIEYLLSAPEKHTRMNTKSKTTGTTELLNFIITGSVTL